MSSKVNQPVRLLTSESVSEGHPDKVADQVSDAILDCILARDPQARVACETLIGPGYMVLAGEVGSVVWSLEELRRELALVARRTVAVIGYNSPEVGFDAKHAEVQFRVGLQSAEIHDQVDRGDGALGAGDQGLMFGYACDETPQLMPLPSALSHRLLERLTALRKSGDVPWLRPDAKSQVTVRYSGDVPSAIDTVVLAAQHEPSVSLEVLRETLERQVVAPTLEEYGFNAEGVRVLINHAGTFALGGPAADTGLTGRKIIVDTYGGSCPHGGGAFSGKDASKVDRSAAYAARWVAKNLVASGLAKRAEVQLAYAIGSLQPVSVRVDTRGSGAVDDAILAAAVQRVFDLSPGGIISALDLTKPRFARSASLGHFGRDEPEFTWERVDRVGALVSSVEAVSGCSLPSVDLGSTGQGRRA